MEFQKFNSQVSDGATDSIMGGINLDPFSFSEANDTVQTDRFFDIRQGQTEFLISWHVKVWCNPTYGSDVSLACLSEDLNYIGRSYWWIY